MFWVNRNTGKEDSIREQRMESENQSFLKKWIGENYTHKTSKQEESMQLSYRRFNKENERFCSCLGFSLFFPQNKIVLFIFTVNFGCQKHRLAEKRVRQISWCSETAITNDGPRANCFKDIIGWPDCVVMGVYSCSFSEHLCHHHKQNTAQEGNYFANFYSWDSIV